MKIKRIAYTILGVISFIGCTSNDQHAGHHHGHESHEGHGGHSHAISRTEWGNNCEVYLSHKPLVVDKSTAFILHITDLNNYDPFVGKVHFEVSINSQIVDKGVLEMKSAGIYKHTSTLPVGKGDIAYHLISDDFEEVIKMNEVEVFGSSEAAEEAAHSNQTKNPNSVEFEKEQAWATTFSSVFAKTDTVYNIIRAGGEITGSVGDEQMVSASAAGMVVYHSNVLIGNRVSKGSTLFTIVSSDIVDHNLQAHFMNAKSVLEKTSSNYDRKQKLFEANAISKSELEIAKMEFELAKTDYNNVASGYAKGGKAIKSKATGFIKQLFKRDGEFASVGDQLATVAANKRLMLKAYVGQTDQAHLAQIVSANFKLNDKCYSIKDFNGKFIAYGRNVTANQPKIPVYFELDNLEDLMVGSFAEVYIQTGKGTPGVVVPNKALLEDYGSYSVVVQTNGETFEVRTVQLGNSDGQYTQILTGVEAGERIVVNGAYQVKMAKMSGKIPAHVH